MQLREVIDHLFLKSLKANIYAENAIMEIEGSDFIACFRYLILNVNMK